MWLAGQKVQVEAQAAAAHVERLLVETGRRRGLAKEGSALKYSDVAVIEAEIVDAALAASTWAVL